MPKAYEVSYQLSTLLENDNVIFSYLDDGISVRVSGSIGSREQFCHIGR
jgi:hypothetical protein